MNSFEKFNEKKKKIPATKHFFSSTKNGKVSDDGTISNGHISVKDYLIYEKTWDKFKIKNG